MKTIRVGLMLAWVIAVVLLAACSEEPSAPREPRRDVKVPTVVRSTTPVICEKNWLYMNDGDWDDPFEWLPSGVPSATDEVCITGAGTYTITISSLAQADSIYIGPGVNVTFTDAGAAEALGADEELVVDVGASVTFGGNLYVIGAALINSGSVVYRDGTVAMTDRIENRGYLELSTSGVAFADVFVNEGDLYTTTVSRFFLEQQAVLASGRVLGPGTLFFYGTSSASRLTWSGGQLGLRGGNANPAQLGVVEATVILDNTSLVGAIDIFTDDDTLSGDIGPGVSVAVKPAGPTYGSLWLAGTSSTSTPLANYGELVLGSTFGFSIVELESARPFENRGTLTALAGDVRLSTRTFDNFGTTRVEPAASVRVGVAQATTVRNEGSVNVIPGANWILQDGRFETSPVGVFTGRFSVEGGTLTGNGQLDLVEATGGVIAPGPGIATLNFRKLTLNPGARVEMEVSSPSRFDRVRVGGEATYAGGLEVTALGGYIGGVCGQVLPMFTDRNSLTGHAPGAFATFAHVPATLNKYWRAHYARDSVIVVGYDPSAWATVTPLSGALAEGGVARTSQFCLNVPVSGADVAAQLSAARGQFTASPGTLTFDRSNYALPQTVRYTAVDDAASEGPHGDTLRIALTQSGAAFGGPPPAPVFAIADNDPAVDLAVSMVSANNAVTTGQIFQARFRVTNIGPGASTGSTFSIPAMSGLSFYSNTEDSRCSSTAGTLTCTLGAIASGGFAEVLVWFSAGSTPGLYSNTLRVRGNDWDNVNSNNSAPWTLTVN